MSENDRQKEWDLLAFYAGYKAADKCYIATMVYGDYDAKEVLVLREFRDNCLKKYLAGRMFVGFYYLVSPLFVKVFKNSKIVNKGVKSVLDKMVLHLKTKKVTSCI